MNDSRLTRWCAHLDDLRTEIADMETESPPADGPNALWRARSAINDAIQSLQYMQRECEVCGGVGRVLRAKRLENGFDWWLGDRIPCPACQK